MIRQREGRRSHVSLRGWFAIWQSWCGGGFQDAQDRILHALPCDRVVPLDVASRAC